MTLLLSEFDLYFRSCICMLVLSSGVREVTNEATVVSLYVCIYQD